MILFISYVIISEITQELGHCKLYNCGQGLKPVKPVIIFFN